MIYCYAFFLKENGKYAKILWLLKMKVIQRYNYVFTG